MRTMLIMCCMVIGSRCLAQRHIGSNLTSVKDYSTEIAFVDVFKQSREWIAYEEGGAWSSGVAVPLRPDGYPLEIPYDNGIDPPQHVRTLMLIDIEGLYPSGQYRLMASGTGQITLWGSASGTFTCPVDQLIAVDSSGPGIFLEIDSSAAADPIHDIRVIIPGSHNTYQTQPFNPLLLDFISDFEAIRFMDMMETNFSPVRSWSDRTPWNYYTQTLETGVAYEYLIALCNTAQKDAWVCIPHMADDDFVQQFATLLQDSLDPGLNVYVEYTNEAWNGIFTQSQYVGDMGDDLGYSGQPWEQGWKYYAKRSADIHHIFETVFTDDSRVINVVGSQVVGYVSDYILDRYGEALYNPDQVQAEALAIAPYFGGGLADRIGDAGMANSVTVNDILDSLEVISLPESFQYMQENLLVAQEHGVQLIAYEGGQHLVSYFHTSNSDFVDTLITVNRHPRMQDLYCQYFDHWYDVIQGGLFCQFSSHGKPSIYGSWGVKEHLTDTLSPKYLGLVNCVFDQNITTINEPEDANIFHVHPNPTETVISVDKQLVGGTFSVYSSMGAQVKHGAVTDDSIDLSDLRPGVYFIRCRTADGLRRKTAKVVKN